MFTLTNSAKADPVLIGSDDAHLCAVAAVLDARVRELDMRLAALRFEDAGPGHAALDRDLEIHRLTGRRRVLTAFGVDLCLGRMMPADRSDPVYVGRIGVTGDDGEPLVVDWRAPVARPFFAATHADPMGLASRRRYRWRDGQVIDYWDEAFDSAELTATAEDPFLAGLAASRSPRMRDVLATLQADQDAIIRADARGALVVDGGPGTGKTVVALHRAAYLLFQDRRIEHDGGLLFVGPHRPYLAYVADILPNLGEEGVQVCTLADLVPEGAAAVEEPDPDVARLKASAELLGAVEPAVTFYEEVPTEPLTVETPWAEVAVATADWVEALATVDPGTPHNDARDLIWEALLDILVDQHGTSETECSADDVHRALAADDDLRDTFRRFWPILDAADLVSDLWSVPAYLKLCAPWLTDEERRSLRRPEGATWTTADLPLLDAMRARLGDPRASARRRRRREALAESRSVMDDVVDRLLEGDDDPESPLPLLRRDSIRAALVDEDVVPADEVERLAGPFGHIVVDEAQELTDAEWRMLLSRCPSRSITIVGDRAQARHGFAESWEERLARLGVDGARRETLTVNYRTPREIMAEAEPIIRAVLPDANVPISIRDGGHPVHHGRRDDLGAILSEWLRTPDEGIACVIAPAETLPPEAVESVKSALPHGSVRVRVLTPDLAKGLEFDLVVLVGPQGDGVTAAVDRYVAMTRATNRLVLLASIHRSAPTTTRPHPGTPASP
ncbi:MAG: AAA family ATPase [Tessaracoccus sp.]|uniref:RNA polymerase recycling motor ATPase HelR n=1 Tax=Tessaracoccus sp. TaxID=1971211 RepID=UPI001EC6DD99|nr:RNA polymerase recycling motor ATPase HelR [Tessaracoccus sp.]MBK7820217.1 AAA family ATPase [Tessaracoccus sp.]